MTIAGYASVVVLLLLAAAALIFYPREAYLWRVESLSHWDDVGEWDPVVEFTIKETAMAHCDRLNGMGFPVTYRVVAVPVKEG